jgi:hypothetical protein
LTASSFEDVVLCGISTPFGMLSPARGKITHVLLTRAPLYRGRSPFSCDLHVLGAPLTFVLSQDQTLQLKTEEPMNPPQRKRTRLEFLSVIEPDFASAGLDAAALTRRFGSPLPRLWANPSSSFESVRFSFQGPSGKGFPRNGRRTLESSHRFVNYKSLFTRSKNTRLVRAMKSGEGGRGYCLQTGWSRFGTVKSGTRSDVRKNRVLTPRFVPSFRWERTRGSSGGIHECLLEASYA